MEKTNTAVILQCVLISYQALCALTVTLSIVCFTLFGSNSIVCQIVSMYSSCSFSVLKG